LMTFLSSPDQDFETTIKRDPIPGTKRRGASDTDRNRTAGRAPTEFQFQAPPRERELCRRRSRSVFMDSIIRNRWRSMFASTSNRWKNCSIESPVAKS